jgi:Leucine-rich repeat (LRR) protein
MLYVPRREIRGMTTLDTKHREASLKALKTFFPKGSVEVCIEDAYGRLNWTSILDFASGVDKDSAPAGEVCGLGLSWSNYIKGKLSDAHPFIRNSGQSRLPLAPPEGLLRASLSDTGRCLQIHVGETLAMAVAAPEADPDALAAPPLHLSLAQLDDGCRKKWLGSSHLQGAISIDLNAPSESAKVGTAKKMKFDLPAEVAAFSKLEALSLQNYRVKGSSLLGTGELHLDWLREAANLRHLDLSECTNLKNLEPLSSLEKLEFLSLDGCSGVKTLAPVNALRKLKHLRLKRLKGLGAYKPWDLEELTDLDEIVTISLPKGETTALPGLSGLTNLRVLELNGQKALVDLGFMDTLEQLRYVDLTGCKSLADLSPMRGKSLAFLQLDQCRLLSDLGPLEELTLLEDLSLRECDKVTDLSPVAALPLLRSIRADKCASLQAIPSLSLPELEVGRFSWLPKLEKVGRLDCPKMGKLFLIDNPKLGAFEKQSLPAVTFLNLFKCSGLESIDGLVASELKTARLENCKKLKSIAPLSSCRKLSFLNVQGCLSLRSVEPLRGLPALATLKVSGSEYLSTESWGPLHDLPAISALDIGQIPFATKVLARAIAAREDDKAARVKFRVFTRIAKENAEEPGLLEEVAKMLAMSRAKRSSVADVLGQLVEVAAVTDVDGAGKVFLTCAPYVLDGGLGEAIARLARQESMPLPPDSLLGLMSSLDVGKPEWAKPIAKRLRDDTLRSLLAQLDEDSPVPWAVGSGSVLNQVLNPRCAEVNSLLQDEALGRIGDYTGGKTELAEGVFTALASVYGRSEDVEWRDGFHERITALALSAPPEARESRLSACCQGIASSSDEQWLLQRLDGLLQSAAEVDPDTSALQAEIASAHASGNRWDEAATAAFGITSQTLRDQILGQLAEDVRGTQRVDRVKRSLELSNGIAHRDARIQSLSDLGQTEELAVDTVSYAALVSLLAEAPDAQREVVKAAVAQVPALAGTALDALASPLTDRERAIERNAVEQVLEVARGLDVEWAEKLAQALA